MLQVFVLIFLIKTSYQTAYHNNCVKEVPSDQVFLKQSFAKETVNYPLLHVYEVPRSLNEYTIGSGIIDDPVNHQTYQFGESVPKIDLTTINDETLAPAATYRLVDGKNFVKDALKDRPRYEWTCPASYYTVPHGASIDVGYTSVSGGVKKLRDNIVAVNHNYFVNMQLNKNVAVYAAYGAVVVHSVNLNNFELKIILKFDFYHVVYGSRSLPAFQITNNYGPGKITIEYEGTRKVTRQRDVIHGGNDADIQIYFIKKRAGQPGVKYKVSPLDMTKAASGYETKSNEEEDDQDYDDDNDDPQIGEQNYDHDEMSDVERLFANESLVGRDYSLVFLIVGGACLFLAALTFFTPFIIPKDNNFELLELYEYYADMDDF